MHIWLLIARRIRDLHRGFEVANGNGDPLVWWSCFRWGTRTWIFHLYGSRLAVLISMSCKLGSLGLVPHLHSIGAARGLGFIAFITYVGTLHFCLDFCVVTFSPPSFQMLPLWGVGGEGGFET
jgi:hypothetical protein